jgi:SAM-dependent methyltransferase
MAARQSVDPRAACGFASRADAYERGRPSYPAAAIGNVARDHSLTQGSTVVDLAAGTGKLARVLAPLVGHVIAVEPSRAMLGELRERLPGVEAMTGTAEAIPLPGESVDAVFVGEAFHWFQTRQACAEIVRVLRPAGSLILVWQRARWAEQQHSWLDAFERIIEPHRRARRYPAGDGDWRLALERTGLFEPLTRTQADYDHHLSGEDFVALVGSWSWIANLSDERRDDVLRAVRELLGDGRALTLRYRTEICSTRLPWVRRCGALPKQRRAAGRPTSRTRPGAGQGWRCGRPCSRRVDR